MKAAPSRREPADDRPFDGINLIPILTGEQPAKDRTLYWRTNRETRQQKAVRHGKWKCTQDSNIEMLFDLGTDVGERRDLSFQHPDIFAGLKRELAGWEAEMARVKTDILVK